MPGFAGPRLRHIKAGEIPSIRFVANLAVSRSDRNLVDNRCTIGNPCSAQQDCIADGRHAIAQRAVPLDVDVGANRTVPSTTVPVPTCSGVISCVLQADGHRRNLGRSPPRSRYCGSASVGQQHWSTWRRLSITMLPTRPSRSMSIWTASCSHIHPRGDGCTSEIVENPA